MATPKRPPQRTCVACRSTTGKRELARVVRTPTGDVEVDPSGKKAGRGAYLCDRIECWEAALKRDRLSSALRKKLTAEDRERLKAYAATLRDAATV